MGRESDSLKSTEHNFSSRQSILLLAIMVYSLGIVGQYFLLNTDKLDKSISQLQDTIQTIEAKNNELLKRLDYLKLQDISRTDKVTRAYRDIFNRVDMVFKDLERYKSGAGRRLRKQIVEAELTRRLSTSLSRMSYEQEKNRRKLETLVRELWLFVEAYQFSQKQVDKATVSNSWAMQNIIRSTDANDSLVSKFKTTLRGYKRSIDHALDTLRGSDGLDNDRLAMSLELGERVQRRLSAVQNPPNCSAAKYIVCPLKPCGFGCVIHHYVQCLIMAYATGRVMVISDESGPDERQPFKDMSETCASENITVMEKLEGTRSQERVLRHVIIEEVSEEARKIMPLAIPADLAPKLNLFHGNPSAWWVGQLAAYIMRPTPEYQQELNELTERLDLEGLYVGIHVRRTDKIIEAAYHELKEYMQYVEQYYENLQTPVLKRKVFLASDENLIDEARLSYPNFTFIHNPNISMDRNSMDGFKGLVTDIFFLAHSQFLVCTFSSQVCRLAYELMQTMHGDASNWFRSLDDIYYFGGQTHHLVRAMESNEEGEDLEGNKIIKLRKGDLIETAGNHWNGFSKGTLLSTGETGLYPSYKVEDVLEYVCLPDFANISSLFPLV
ncbi:alpha-(1,6)-fucosyltransferase-like [Biomphalaria glabrata]|uniref:Alpha-(1,6)-fucosyltransferase-like n=1 Tax=Biomphalaria glabrata TaxID=6526 RepID=A0A9W2YPW8_BIOGL|nr:alpha-(1,6)-fucosyltransferase-like [Biomphalaria glabrata]XP_055864773.1 alpha-(1,6)-fucosyltransferase-like [Biomphalaria glabrata]